MHIGIMAFSVHKNERADLATSPAGHLKHELAMDSTQLVLIHHYNILCYSVSISGWSFVLVLVGVASCPLERVFPIMEAKLEAWLVVVVQS